MGGIGSSRGELDCYNKMTIRALFSILFSGYQIYSNSIASVTDSDKMLSEIFILRE
ncbi:MAG: hypothetical protein ACFFCE_17560 [Promethearchaeota archaeon]